MDERCQDKKEEARASLHITEGQQNKKAENYPFSVMRMTMIIISKVVKFWRKYNFQKKEKIRRRQLVYFWCFDSSCSSSSLEKYSSNQKNQHICICI